MGHALFTSDNEVLGSRVWSVGLRVEGCRVRDWLRVWGLGLVTRLVTRLKSIDSPTTSTTPFIILPPDSPLTRFV